VPHPAPFVALSPARTTAGGVLVLDARDGCAVVLRPCQRRPCLAVSIANAT
jgi:hypothetical protein